MIQGIPLPAILLVQVPLIAIWLYVLWDIGRQELPVGRKLLWAAACSIVWPVQFVYLLARPQRGRAERTDRPRTRHERFVRAVLDRESGRIDRDEFAATVQGLARHPAAPPHLPRPLDGRP